MLYESQAEKAREGGSVATIEDLHSQLAAQMQQAMRLSSTVQELQLAKERDEREHARELSAMARELTVPCE